MTILLTALVCLALGYWAGKRVGAATEALRWIERSTSESGTEVQGQAVCQPPGVSQEQVRQLIQGAFAERDRAENLWRVHWGPGSAHNRQ